MRQVPFGSASRIAAVQASMGRLIGDLDNVPTSQVNVLRAETQTFLSALDAELSARSTRTDKPRP